MICWRSQHAVKGHLSLWWYIWRLAVRSVYSRRSRIKQSFRFQEGKPTYTTHTSTYFIYTHRLALHLQPHGPAARLYCNYTAVSPTTALSFHPFYKCEHIPLFRTFIAENSPEIKFLDISLTKDLGLLLYAVHNPFYWQIWKKTILFSGFKSPCKKYAKQEHSSLFMNNILQKKEGRKPNQKPRLNMPVKNSISGQCCVWEPLKKLLDKFYKLVYTVTKFIRIRIYKYMVSFAFRRFYFGDKTFITSYTVLASCSSCCP
jgi:hypothetical protein